MHIKDILLRLLLTTSNTLPSNTSNISSILPPRDTLLSISTSPSLLLLPRSR